MAVIYTLIYIYINVLLILNRANKINETYIYNIYMCDMCGEAIDWCRCDMLEL